MSMLHSIAGVASVCLSVLSETLVYCGQTVVWIKMKLGIGRPRPRPHCVGWDPAPNFRPMSVVAQRLDGLRSVSYTHLTLPTIYSV